MRTDTASARRDTARAAALTIWSSVCWVPIRSGPTERFDDAVIDYLRSGLAAGMSLPDATDPTLERIRVVAAAGGFASAGHG